MPSRRDVLRLGAGVLAAGVTAGCSGAPSGQEATAATTTGAPTRTATRSAEPGEESVYTAVYRESIDSVVLVRADAGQGTGWLFDDSVVVTNEHVVGQTDGVDVRFDDGEWREGRVLGSLPLCVSFLSTET